MKSASAAGGLLLLLAMACAGGWAVWRNQQLRQIEPAGLLKTNGRLGVARLEIATKFPGRIVEIPVGEGDTVKAGDVIARMDTTDLEAQLAGVEAMSQRAAQATLRAQGETQVRQVQLRVAQMELLLIASPRCATDATKTASTHGLKLHMLHAVTCKSDSQSYKEFFIKAPGRST